LGAALAGTAFESGGDLGDVPALEASAFELVVSGLA